MIRDTSGRALPYSPQFRSRAVIEFGDPIQIPQELVDKYIRGGAEKRMACGLLLDTIYTSLKAITTTAPDYDTLMVGLISERHPFLYFMLMHQ